MVLKILGAIFVVTACGSVGFKMAANHRREEQTLRDLIGIMDYLECELQYHLTPLPLLCRQAAKENNGVIGKVFYALAQELETQLLPDLASCMETALNKSRQLSQITKGCLELLGKSIGRFDLEGQKKGFEAVRQECRRQLDQLCFNREYRIRNYQTLGLCAGAALAILFV